MRNVNDINQRTLGAHAHPASGGRSPYQGARGARQAYAARNVDPSNQSKADFVRDANAYHAMAKKRSGGKRTAFIILAAVLLVMLVCGTAFGLFVSGVTSQLNKGTKSDAELLAIEDALGGYSSNFDEPFYMLLLGSDARVGEDKSRSDTNIVVRVDPVDDKLTMVSIPRDTKIEIPGHGTQKFNAAYAFGKVPGVIEAAEELLDIEISHYAEVNFLDLKGLVDAVGGVTVEVETRIDDYHCDDGDGNHYVIEKGTQTLGGGEALTFARSRHYANGDFTRTSNQRKLVEAIVHKVLATPITNIPAVVSAAAECVTTDLKLMDIIGLAQQFADNKDIVFYNAMIPSYTQNINGISFVINDEEKTKEMMKLFVAGEDPSGIVSTLTASDIHSTNVDTSNVLLFDDDDEVASGTVPANPNTTPSGSGGTSSSSSTTAGGSSGTGNPDGSDAPSGSGTGSGTGTSGGSTTTPSVPDTPSVPETPSGGGSSGGEGSGSEGGGSSGGGSGSSGDPAIDTAGTG